MEMLSKIDDTGITTDNNNLIITKYKIEVKTEANKFPFNLKQKKPIALELSV
jgi:hypothetical protein